MCSADPAHYTVDAIAHRCGFTNRSRFAAAHETIYDKHRSNAARRTLITQHGNGPPNANRYPNNAN